MALYVSHSWKILFASVTKCMHGIYDLVSLRAKHICKCNAINLKFGVLKDAYLISSNLEDYYKQCTFGCNT